MEERFKPMNLIRWRPRRETGPFGELLGIQEEIKGLFDVTLGRRPFERVSIVEGEWAPAIDLLEDENRVVVKAELSGMAQEDIEVRILGDTLTIKGEKKRESSHQRENYHRRERAYGAFHRSISLPTSVVPDKASASFKNGMLKIDMPKKEEARPRQIRIDAS
jgi:HSP20 family protein